MDRYIQENEVEILHGIGIILFDADRTIDGIHSDLEMILRKNIEVKYAYTKACDFLSCIDTNMNYEEQKKMCENLLDSLRNNKGLGITNIIKHDN